MLPIVEQILLALIEAVGGEAIVRFVFSKTDDEKKKAILDAEYATMEASLDAAQKAAAKEP